MILAALKTKDFGTLPGLSQDPKRPFIIGTVCLPEVQYLLALNERLRYPVHQNIARWIPQPSGRGGGAYAMELTFTAKVQRYPTPEQTELLEPYRQG